MAVYYRFKSGLKIESMPIDGRFISVTLLKKRIIETKKFWWKDDLTITNAQTNEEYDDTTLIPRCTSLVVCRLRGPAWSRRPIIVNPNKSKAAVNNVVETPTKTSSSTVESCVTQCLEETNWDDFGEDMFSVAEVPPVKSDSEMQNNADGSRKIGVSTDSYGLGHNHIQLQDSSAGGRSMGGRAVGERGFGWGGYEVRKPPQGYICFRCNVPGHFIQHCPTNGDPSFDIKGTRHTSFTTDYSHTLSSGFVDVLKENDAYCNKRVRGLSSTQSGEELPPELHCPLCKEVMKDAMMTSKCCFNSFCDTCIRNQIISKSICACGATNILANDLVANQTLRNTITRMLESSSINSGVENAGSALEIHDAPRSSEPNQSVPIIVSGTSTGGRIIPPSPKKYVLDLEKSANNGNKVADPQAHSFGKERSTKPSDLSELTTDAMHKKETKLQASAPHAEVEGKQKLPTKESAAETLWKNSQDSAAESLTLPFPHSNNIPYFYSHTGGMPFIDYAYASFNLSHEGVYIQDPFQAQQYAMPIVPGHRDLSGFMRREGIEERNTDLKRKREKCCSRERECYSSQELCREQSNNVGVSSMKLKSIMQRTVTDERNHKNRAEKAHTVETEHMTNNKTRTYHHYHKENNHNRMASGYSQTSVTESTVNKKSKVSSTEIDCYKDPDLRASSCSSPSSSSTRGKSVVKMEQDSSDVDDERHFKRRPRSSKHSGRGK